MTRRTCVQNAYMLRRSIVPTVIPSGPRARGGVGRARTGRPWENPKTAGQIHSRRATLEGANSDFAVTGLRPDERACVVGGALDRSFTPPVGRRASGSRGRRRTAGSGRSRRSAFGGRGGTMPRRAHPVPFERACGWPLSRPVFGGDCSPSPPLSDDGWERLAPSSSSTSGTNASSSTAARASSMS